MYKFRLRNAIYLLVLSGLFVISCESIFTSEKPKLVIMITPDQFRADYLEKYNDAFEGGFRRLLDEGWRYDKALVDHAPTLSWPGHTTIHTGAYPKNHGVCSNEIINEQGYRMPLFLDRDENILGYPRGISYTPKITKVSGLSEWLREVDPESRSVSINTTMTALCYGGKPQTDRTKNHVYWIEPSAGEFVTSTYYRDSYPDWLVRFNEEIVPEYRNKLNWENTVPEKFRHLARNDEASFEHDGVHTAFPHNIKDFYPEENPQTVNMYFSRFNPYANEALFALARESINELKLGQRESTDFLAISIGLTDRMGHDFGPCSLEQYDTILRLDRLLGEFFDFLDNTIGKDNYVLSLTGDHGGPNIVEYELEQGRPAKRISEEEIKNLLDDIDKFVNNYSGAKDRLTYLIAKELEKSEFVARAMTPEELGGTDPADHILESYRKSYLPGFKSTFPLWTNNILRGYVGPNHPGNYGIIVEYIENGQLYTAKSAHATSYSYDQEVPIIIMGKGVKSGVAEDKARTIDIAPTLAELAGIKFPGTVDGKALKIGK
ncbi:alkaline phosphatase family protein [candidate division KSB1 bacterium]